MMAREAQLSDRDGLDIVVTGTGKLRGVAARIALDDAAYHLVIGALNGARATAKPGNANGAGRLADMLRAKTGTVDLKFLMGLGTLRFRCAEGRP